MNEFASALLMHGDRLLAVDDAGVSLSYRQAAEAVQVWRDQLGSGKKLALLLCRNTCPVLEAYLGLLGSGHVTMLVGSDTDPKAIEDIKSRYQPDVVITPSETGLDVQNRPVESDVAAIHTDVALLLSTSGSTGAPKFAQFSQAALYANAQAIQSYLELDVDERPYVHLPMHYSYGMSVINSHVLAGATLLLSERSIMDPVFWQRMQTEGATSFSGVPLHYEILLRLGVDRKAPESLRTFTQAGGRLAPKFVSRMAELAAQKGWRFYVMYGQTEAGPRISYVPHDNIAHKPETIGVPIPGVSISLVDETGADITSPDTEGEMVVRSAAIMLGYTNDRSDLGLGDRLQGVLVTGDLARRDNEGYLTVTGRKSRFIKLQGNRVSLEDVERRMAEHGHTVVCIGEDDRLYIAAEGGGGTDKVREAVFDLFKFPVRNVSIVAVAAFPRVSSGKILYKGLADLISQQTAAKG